MSDLENIMKQIHSSVLEMKDELNEIRDRIDAQDSDNKLLTELHEKVDSISMAFGVATNVDDTSIDDKYTPPVKGGKKSDKKDDYPKYLGNVQTFVKHYYVHHRDILLEKKIFTEADEDKIRGEHKAGINKKKTDEDKKKFLAGKMYLEIIRHNPDCKKRLDTFKKNEKAAYSVNNTQILTPDNGK